MLLTELAQVALWLEILRPGASIDDIQSIITTRYGKLKRHTAMGYGEGYIGYSVNGVIGHSSGDCTNREAILNLAYALMKQEDLAQAQGELVSDVDQEQIELGIASIGEFDIDNCTCDASVGFSPCHYCAEYAAIQAGKRMLERVRQRLEATKESQ